MYTGFYHTHKLTVTLFLLIYVIKLILLLVSKEKLEKFTKVVKVPEMIISFGFLATGVYLAINTAEINGMLLGKFAVVLLAIPLAIIGFKNSKKPLAIIAVVFIFAAYGLAEMNKSFKAKKQPLAEALVTDNTEAGYDITAHGQALFLSKCALCHGNDGKGELSGAKDLTLSKMNIAAITDIINNGKNTMPKFTKTYSVEEIEALAVYVNGLKTN